MRLSGWCRGVAADVERSLPLGLDHYNLSISTSDYMIQNKFRGKLDRNAILREMTAAVRLALRPLIAEGLVHRTGHAKSSRYHA